MINAFKKDTQCVSNIHLSGCQQWDKPGAEPTPWLHWLRCESYQLHSFSTVTLDLFSTILWCTQVFWQHSQPKTQCGYFVKCGPLLECFRQMYWFKFKLIWRTWDGQLKRAPWCSLDVVTFCSGCAVVLSCLLHGPKSALAACSYYGILLIYVWVENIPITFHVQVESAHHKISTLKTTTLEDKHYTDRC